MIFTISRNTALTLANALDDAVGDYGHRVATFLDVSGAVSVTVDTTDADAAGAAVWLREHYPHLAERAGIASA